MILLVKMKNYILVFLLVGLSFAACNNPYEKEIGEVDALLSIVDETEQILLSVDTARVFAAKRQLEQDFEEFTKYADTLEKKEAFKIADIFAGKRNLNHLARDYAIFSQQLDISRKQLENLKQDLKNDLIKKENYKTYYVSEQKAIMELNHKIKASVDGIETIIGKYELDRPELLKIIEQKKQKAANEE